MPAPSPAEDDLKVLETTVADLDKSIASRHCWINKSRNKCDTLSNTQNDTSHFDAYGSSSPDFM